MAVRANFINVAAGCHESIRILILSRFRSLHGRFHHLLYELLPLTMILNPSLIHQKRGSFRQTTC